MKAVDVKMGSEVKEYLRTPERRRELLEVTLGVRKSENIVVQTADERRAARERNESSSADARR